VSKSPLPNDAKPDLAYIERKQKAQADSNWIDHPDVDYTDLDHFIGNCRRLKDKESFDVAIRILQAIKKQVTERKS
jgi:hypothetical protein